MEEQRYEQSRALFVTGIVCLIISLTLITFSLYILPAMVWNWFYGVPEFLFFWRESFVDAYAMSDSGSGLSVFAIFFVPGIIAVLASVWISNKIDKKALGLTVESEEESGPKTRVTEEIKESFGFGVKLFLLSLAVVLAVFFVNWLLSTNPPNV